MPRVTIYSAEWCPWCQRTKHFLAEHRIKFEEKDVDSNPENAHELVHKSGQTGIPVIEIDGQIVVGFDQEKLRNLLKLDNIK